MNEIKYTHRTKSGLKARIITDSLVDTSFPIVAAVLIQDGRETVELYTRNLTWLEDQPYYLDLVECSPWDDVERDTKIWVRDYDGQDWLPRHFAFYNESSKRIHTYGCGSRWTTPNNETVGWKQAKLASEFTHG